MSSYYNYIQAYITQDNQTQNDKESCQWHVPHVFIQLCTQSQKELIK